MVKNLVHCFCNDDVLDIPRSSARDAFSNLHIGDAGEQRRPETTRTHNPKVVGSNPAPATKSYKP